MPLSRTTKDPGEIRKWAESRGAVPAEVASTDTDSGPGILRFMFPKAPRRKDAALREISWDDFFRKFEQNHLVMVYQDKTAAGRTSNFNKLIHPDSIKRPNKSRSSSGGSSHGSSSASGHHHKAA